MNYKEGISKVMKDDSFKEALKVDTDSLARRKSPEEDKDLEALYSYTADAVQNISAFLLDFYLENPTKDMTESESTKPTYAQSFYGSLGHEIVSKYSDFKDGKLSTEEFEKQFNSVLAHYKTDTLTIRENYANLRATERNYVKNHNKEELQSFVSEIEEKAEACWEKIEEEKQNQH